MNLSWQSWGSKFWLGLVQKGTDFVLEILTKGPPAEQNIAVVIVNLLMIMRH